MNRLSRTFGRHAGSGIGGLVALVFSLGVVAQPLGDAVPLDPQPAAAQLASGLAVTYYYANFRDVADVAELVPGKEGEPIAVLDHVSNSGKVLTSDRPMGVGAAIRGFIEFPSAGVWTFRVNSNDGVRLSIGGVLVHEDPEVHSDSMSEPLELAVPGPGRYAFEVDYFQRKGTYALQVFWTPPGGTETIVPATAYAHLKP